MDRVTRHGKQLKLDGRHLADCVDEHSAHIIKVCLNLSGIPSEQWPTDTAAEVERFFA